MFNDESHNLNPSTPNLRLRSLLEKRTNLHERTHFMFPLYNRQASSNVSRGSLGNSFEDTGRHIPSCK